MDLVKVVGESFPGLILIDVSIDGFNDFVQCFCIVFVSSASLIFFLRDITIHSYLISAS